MLLIKKKIILSLCQDIFGKLQLWKLIGSVFAFSSTPELLFGLYLLYYFRVFERQIGSNKYSVSNHPV
jgi:membrane associated rhomboid family serine protease